MIEDLHDNDQVMPNNVEEIKLDSDFTVMDFHKAVMHSCKMPFRISHYINNEVRSMWLYNKHKNDPELKNNKICAVKRSSPKATLLKTLVFEL